MTQAETPRGVGNYRGSPDEALHNRDATETAKRNLRIASRRSPRSATMRLAGSARRDLSRAHRTTDLRWFGAPETDGPDREPISPLEVKSA